MRKMALASIMTALTVVCLFGSVFLPTGRIALLSLTSFCVLITHVECGTRYSIIQFLATALIAVLTVPFKSQVILFVAFIGYYPIVKSYMEHIRIRWLEWLVKILFFNAVLIVAYLLLKYFLLAYISFGSIFNYVFSHLAAVIAVFEIVFILYDYLLSLLVSYYINVIQPKLKFK